MPKPKKNDTNNKFQLREEFHLVKFLLYKSSPLY